MVIAVFFAATLCCVGVATTVRAGSAGWTAGSATAGKTTAVEPRPPCTSQSVRIGDNDIADLCVYRMNGWRFALYTRPSSPDGSSGYEHLFVIGLGTDTKMYVVRGMEADPRVIGASSTSDTFTYSFCCSAGHTGGTPIIINDMPSKIRRIAGPTGVEYALSQSARTGVASLDGEPLYALATAVSPNGRWVAVYAENTGIVRIDPVTGEALRLTQDLAVNGEGISVSLAVTDDGRTVFAGGATSRARFLDVYDATDCGDQRGRGRELERPCTQKDLTDVYGIDDTPLSLAVTADGSRLSVSASARTAFIYAPGITARPVSYLALGDSFASGEGDTQVAPDGYKYYAAYTDKEGHDGTPAEKCHQSTRSYPYLLRPILGLLADQARSVACSGAKLGDVTGRTGYDGQGERLAVMVPVDRAASQAEALQLFIPGRIPQIDFVRRYMPSLATLGVGGNDVGFQPVLTACAHPVPLTTCSYATDPTDRRNLGEAVRGAYPALRDTYADVRAASPGVSLYVTGYPWFVDPTTATCPLDVNLDIHERKMVDEGVRYINAVIKAAARSAGAEYVDIEKVFEGHRLCEGDDPYVNPIVLFFGREKSESFHPNHKGQAAIADAVTRQTDSFRLPMRSPGEECGCEAGPPPLPPYFGDDSVVPPFIAIPTEFVAAYLIVNDIMTWINASGFLPGSTVRLEIHSDPVVIGNFVADDEGRLNVPVKLDGVRPGYHTLHAYGVSPSGEKLDMFQVIEVGDKGVSANKVKSEVTEEPGAKVEDDRLPPNDVTLEPKGRVDETSLRTTALSAPLITTAMSAQPTAVIDTKHSDTHYNTVIEPFMYGVIAITLIVSACRYLFLRRK